MIAAKQLLLWIACGLLGLASCTKEPSRNEDRIIAFDAGIQEADTRSSSYVEGTQFEVEDCIGVLAFPVPDGVWKGNETSSLLYNSELTKIADETFRYNPIGHWPSIGKASFFAYYPFSNSLTQGIVTPSPLSQTGYPSVTVVLGKSKEPVDFMTAQQELTDYQSSNDGIVRFSFFHRLAKIRFKARFENAENDVKLYINTLKIKNIFNKAVYSFSSASSGGVGEWKDHGNEGTADAVSGASLSVNASILAVGETYGDILLPSGQDAYVLMIPQKYPTAELEIGYMLEYIKSGGGCEYHIMGTKNLPISVDWKMGQVYTYRFDFAFSEILGLTIKTDVLTGASDWVKVPVGTEMGN